MVPHRRSERGYNLVILMMTLTVLNIMMAAALPKWSHVIRRDREEELVSRGFQYAEAIRIFQNRFQRLPVRLEELLEVEPRSIRRLWKDPMTEDGMWVLIPPGNGGPTLTPQTAAPIEESEGRGDSGKPSEEVPDNTGIGQKKGTVQVGPFTGVHSRSSKESILIFNGHDHYDEWHFTVEMLMQGNGNGNNQMPPGGAAGNPAQGGGLQLSTRWLGRPLPQFLQAAQGGMPQDGESPGQPGQPGKKPRPTQGGGARK